MDEVLAEIFDRFEICAEFDGDHLLLRCVDCDSDVCLVEAGDTLRVLAATALDHGVVPHDNDDVPTCPDCGAPHNPTPCRREAADCDCCRAILGETRS